MTDKWGASEEDDHAHWDKFRRDIYLRGNPVSASALPSAAPSAYASPIPTAPPSEYGGSDDEDDDDEDEDGSDDDQVDRQLRRKRRLEKKRKSFKVPPNVVFMRLKERCFVNDKEGRDLSEASFDGEHALLFYSSQYVSLMKVFITFSRVLLHCSRAKSSSRPPATLHLQDITFRTKL